MDVVVQLSDPHITAGDPGPDRALAAAVAHVARLDPAPVAVLLTGDLTHLGRPEEYARVRELLAPLAAPVHPLPGNHDDRDALRAAFADHPGVAASRDDVRYVTQCGGLRVVACDTTVPGQDGARLDADRIAWLEAHLTAPGAAPTVLALHHAPLVTAIPAMDAVGLPDADRAALAGVVARAPSLRRIVAGHVHRPITGVLAGCPVVVAPSTDVQVALDLVGERITILREPPGFALHVLAGEHLVSHVQPVGDFGPPVNGA